MTKNNAFGFLRHVAALMVVFSHSYPIALGGGAHEPPHPYAPFSLGTAGVFLFFAISGILVTKSFIESKSPIHFIVYRVSRIYPGVIVCLLFTTFLIGPLYTGNSLKAYFSNIGIYEHFFHNAGLLTDVYSSLPRVFENNPLPFAINNSIWTLVWELRAYFLILIGGYLLGVKRSWKGGAALLFFVALASFTFLREGRQAYFLVAFFLGGFLYQVRNYFTRRYSALAFFTILAALLYGTKFFEAAFVVWTVFFVFVIGSLKTNAFLKLDRYDLSYGLYLYAFPIGQALTHTFKIDQPILLFFATAVVTGIIALISWHYVEEPILKNKQLIADYLWVVTRLRLSPAEK